MFLLPLFSGIAFAQEVPVKYENAMVFPGGEMATAIFLGMYEATVEAGKKPDVVLATCGGSIGAAITASLTSTTEMKSLLESEEFYGVLKTLSLTKTAEIENIMKLVYSIKKAHRGHDRGFNQYYILNVPQSFGTDFIKKDFSSTSPIVMVASKIDGDQFKETYFTDEKTAHLLVGLTSSVSHLSNGVIEPLTEVRTDVGVLSALRASISDPYFMQPASVGEDHYLGGIVDLYAIETAKALANHVIMPYSVEPDHFIFSPAIKGVFGFNVYSRLKEVHDEDADFWVDISDMGSVVTKAGFGPEVQLFRLVGNFFEGLFTHPRHIDFDLMSLGVPSSYEDYVAQVDFLWAYGKDRMKEAYEHPNDLSHIRRMSKYNASKKLIAQVKQERSETEEENATP